MSDSDRDLPEDDWHTKPPEEGDRFHQDAEESPEIQELLDLGYEQLDAFGEWVDASLEMGPRISEQDVCNVEFLIDYLANYQHKDVAGMNEFELRWFMFSHYIRKASMEEEIEERLPESLQRFFAFLRREHRELTPIWVENVLNDTAFYARRRREYALLESLDEREWEIGFRNWCAELEDDLDVRCLWMPREIGDGLEWADVMGWREATLYLEANENWQHERELLLNRGLDYEAARVHLLDSYEAWLETSQSRLDDETPREVIQTERLERAEAEPNDENDSDQEDPYEG